MVMPCTHFDILPIPTVQFKKGIVMSFLTPLFQLATSPGPTRCFPEQLNTNYHGVIHIRN